ncbi:hypothetical protein [Pseudomarimonas salicorniae]|uniref:Uncharacterized protein n=1 Tax=Pseudomarimonas salicorniae TaxID=2933270 RepID=A0ABT0GCI4_9GAMM|nr:hypothetical protein [Lysobacter sp. CAU 1642]MCK7592254.1 hypothetical protein [Lysobacter sp. CAU 1642]
MKRLLTALGLLAALFALPAAEARHEPRVRMSLEDLHRGHSLPTAHYAGDRFVAGEHGQAYAIRLANTTPRRLLVVLSVDGINAVTGETAAPDQRGYVLGPYQQTVVRGWRKSLDEVAEFRFAALPYSYAARTGRPDNVGVVGVAVFEERELRPPPAPLPQIGEGRRDSRQRAAPAAEASKSLADAGEAEALGTAHGSRRWDPARQVGFRRASRHPVESDRLYYDSRDNLVAAGILPARYLPRDPRRADPFPLGFVPDP